MPETAGFRSGVRCRAEDALERGLGKVRMCADRFVWTEVRQRPVDEGFDRRLVAPGLDQAGLVDGPAHDQVGHRGSVGHGDQRAHLGQAEQYRILFRRPPDAVRLAFVDAPDCLRPVLAGLILHNRLTMINEAPRVGGAAPVLGRLGPHRLVTAVLVEREGFDHCPQY